MLIEEKIFTEDTMETARLFICNDFFTMLQWQKEKLYAQRVGTWQLIKERFNKEMCQDSGKAQLILWPVTNAFDSRFMVKHSP